MRGIIEQRAAWISLPSLRFGLRAGDRSPGSIPCSRYQGASLSSPKYLHANHQGSIVAVASSLGALEAINAYDAWGMPKGAATATASDDNVGRFQYTGQIWLPELGMYHYKARIYSPGLGRFLQTDPIGYEDQQNLYAYVGNDPVNATDPSGMIGTGSCAESEARFAGVRCWEADSTASEAFLNEQGSNATKPGAPSTEQSSRHGIGHNRDPTPENDALSGARTAIAAVLRKAPLLLLHRVLTGHGPSTYIQMERGDLSRRGVDQSAGPHHSDYAVNGCAKQEFDKIVRQTGLPVTSNAGGQLISSSGYSVQLGVSSGGHGPTLYFNMAGKIVKFRFSAP